MTTRGSKKNSRWLLALVSLFWLSEALALGTAANTLVTNNVSVDFELNLVPQAPIGDSVDFDVDHKVAISITAAGASVLPGESSRALTYVIRNIGNTAQGYALTVIPLTGADDDFDMNNVEIYRDGNANGVFDPGVDNVPANRYNSGSGLNFGDVAADATITVFVVANVPPGGGGSAPANGATARYDLVATTLDAGSNTPTTQSSGAWDPNNVQTVFADGDGDGTRSNDAAQDGKFSATGTFAVNSPVLAKSAVVQDLQGGTTASNGATITYTLVVTFNGSGNANNVVITDAIPANTTYTAGSLTLNTVPLSDTAGNDAGDFNITTNSITVNLGTLSSGSTNTITFKVTINP